jgi:alanyl aminopeptidase
VELSVGPYVAREVKGAAVPGAVWTLRGHEAFGEGLANEVPALLGALSDWFGSPPPYPKLDWIAVPEFTYGAMENPGAIVITEDATRPLAQQTREDAEQLSHFAAHEMAHLWFGDWVTMAWWDDLWLNESFAEWLSQRIVRRVHPEWTGDLERAARLPAVLVHDARPVARPLRAHVPPDEIFEHIDFGTVYGKGEAVLDHVDAWLGADAVQRGVRAYLQAHAFGAATSSDLFAALGPDVTPILDRFVSTAGAPRLSFERVGGQVRVRQEPLRRVGEEPPSPGPWTVPVRMRIGRPDGSTEVVTRLLSSTQEDWDLGPVAWILPAADGIGYYAWSLDDADLDSLIRVAPSLPAVERLAVVGSLATDRASGDRRIDDVLRRAAAFDADPEPRVVSAVAGLVDEVQVARDIGDAALMAAADRYVVGRLGPMLDRVGREPVAGEPIAVTELRQQLVYDLARAHDPRVRADGLAAGWAALKDPAAWSDPEKARFGLRILAEDGPPDVGAQLRAAAAAEADPVRHQALVGATAQVHGEDGIHGALAWATGPDVPPSEAFEVLSGILGRDRESERDFALTEVLASWGALKPKVPPVRWTLPAEFARGCSAARVERVRAWFAGQDVPGADLALDEVATAVATCVARKTADEPGLRALLGGAP